jgi:ABC-2 type transport system permease protein
VWASSLARSQITAFIVAVGVMFALVLVGLDPLLVGLPPALGTIAARIGILSHFESMGRGVVDLRDVIYFLSLAGVFLAFATGALLGRKLAPASAAHRRLRLGVALLASSLVVVNLLGGYIGGRLDLSPGQAYTLAPASRHIVRDLDDLVTVTLYASRELPTEVALMKRDVDDLLRDLRSAGGGRLRVVERDPGADESVKREAETAGVQAV